MPEETAVPFHFSDAEQQRETSEIGMWIFLATEVMFFGALFTAFACFRHLYPAGFEAAAKRTDLWLGAGNTAVLLISSWTMAHAVHASKQGQTRRLIGFLMLTMGLGWIFLGLKGIEYAHHIHDHLLPGASFQFDSPASGIPSVPSSPASPARGAEVFFYLYFVMTGLHALHMFLGICVLFGLMILAWRGRFGSAYHTPVVLAGLYWHFVDIVWIFLFPMFYLSGGH